MDGLSGSHRSGPPGLHRRNLDQDQHGATARLGPAGPALARQGAAWPVDDHDLPCRSAPRSRRGALADRWTDRWRKPLYIDKVLIPTLHPGDVVIMDNLGSHRSSAVRRALRAAGAKLFFLPKYSPDLNPIEVLFSQLKHGLRKAAKRISRRRLSGCRRPAAYRPTP
jgi:hypothetical protein